MKKVVDAERKRGIRRSNKGYENEHEFRRFNVQGNLPEKAFFMFGRLGTLWFKGIIG